MFSYLCPLPDWPAWGLDEADMFVACDMLFVVFKFYKLDRACVKI